MVGEISFIFAQSSQDVVNLDKQAKNFYEKKNFCKALPLYSQLLSLDKNNAEYAFRFGVCLLHCDRRDAELPVKYIKQSQGKLKTSDSLYYHFYLGVACHQAFRFGEAIRAFRVFLQKRGVPEDLRKEARLRMQMCENAINLMKNLSEIAVLQKITADLNTFYKSYDLSKFEGSIGKKPDFLKTSYDKKMKDDGLVFYYPKSNYVYYSSYGKNAATGKDIYRVKRLPDGKWGKAERLSDIINTPYDEDYPVLMDGGKTLYFSSKGHNSMGGYDIFRSVWDETTQSWSEPENLDFAINTPYDDILFIPHPTLKYAWFASNRMVTEGKLHVFLVRIDKPVREFDDYKPQLLTVDYLEINKDDYVKTIQKIQQLATLEVNTREEIPDTKDTSKYVLWQRYNIPPNPADTQLINRAFSYSADAEKKLKDFSRKRAFYNQLSVQKKNEALKLNQQGQSLYDKALKENDPEKRKMMLNEANDILKQSNDLLTESEVAKKMYEQFDQAYDFQQKKYDELLYLAGRVQQTALARNIDSSVVLLINLINRVDSFKFQLVQVERSIEGDNDYLIEQEKKYTNLLAELQQKEKQFQQTEDKISSLDAQIKKTPDPAEKQNLETQRNQYLQSKNQLSEEIQLLKQKINAQKENLTQYRQELAVRSKIKREYDIAGTSGQLVALNIEENQQQSQINPVQNTSNLVETKENAQKTGTNANQQVTAQNVNSSRESVQSQQQINNIDKTKLQQQSKATDDDRKQKENAFKQKVQENMERLSRYEKNYQDSLSFYESISYNLSKIFQQKKVEYEKKVKETTSGLDEIWAKAAELQAIHEAILYADQKKAFYEQQKKQVNSLRHEFSKLTLKDSSHVVELEKQSTSLTGKTSPILQFSSATRYDSLKNASSYLDEQISSVTAREKYLSHRKDSLQKTIEKTRNKKKRSQLERELSLVQLNLKEVQDELEPVQKEKEKTHVQLRYYEKVQQSRSGFFSQFEYLSKTSSDQKPIVSGTVMPEVAIIPPWTDEELRQIRENLLAQESERNNQSLSGRSVFHLSSWLKDDQKGMIKDVRQYLDGDEKKEKDVQARLFRLAGDAMMLRVVELKNDASLNSDPATQQYAEALEKMARNYYSMSESLEKEKGEANTELDEKIRGEDLHPSLVAQYHMEKYQEASRRSDSLRNELGRARTPEEKMVVERKIKEQDNLARYHFYMAQDIYGIWNNVQIEWLQSDVEADQNIRNEIIEARKLRSQAFQEKNFTQQQKMYEKAQEKEVLIILSLSRVISKNKVAEKMQSIANELEREKKKPLRQIFDSYVTSSDRKDDLITLSQKNNKSSQQTNQPTAQVSGGTDRLQNQQNSYQRTINNEVEQRKSVEENKVVEQNRTNNQSSHNSPSGGIYYRVQIAASKREVNPQQYFNETDVVVDYHNGWYCYMKGIFYCYDDARREMMNLRGGRYKDAFLVAFSDADRIPVFEARKVDNCASKGVSAGAVQAGTEPRLTNVTQPVPSSEVDGLVFTVQVGVFAMPRTSSQLFGLNPLLYDRLENGYYRYFNGIFTDLDEAIQVRDKLRKTFVPDAFVVALYKGKKISVAEARQLMQKGVTPGTSYTYSQQVSIEPIEFRIQIGAYRNEVPVEVVNRMLEVSTNMSVDKIYQDDMTFYTVGKFQTYEEARKYLNERVKPLFPDAFVIRVQGGKKIK